MNLERRIDDLVSPEIAIRQFDVYGDTALFIVAYFCSLTDGSANRLVQVAINSERIIPALCSFGEVASVGTAHYLESENGLGFRHAHARREHVTSSLPVAAFLLTADVSSSSYLAAVGQDAVAMPDGEPRRRDDPARICAERGDRDHAAGSRASAEGLIQAYEARARQIPGK